MPSPITALELIKSSMRLAGIIAASEVPTADEADDALATLNDLLDAWAVENLMLFRQLDLPFNLVGGQQTYTIGAGGNFNTARPVNIDGAYVNYAGIDFPLTVLTDDQWNAIELKSMQSPLPLALYYDPAMPQGLVSIWPIPTAALPIVISTGMQFDQAATLATTLIYPPGYAKFTRYSLASELLVESGMPPNPQIEATVTELRGKLKVANSRPKFSPLDPMLDEDSAYGLADFLSGR